MSEIENMVNNNSDIRSCARLRVAAKKRERRLKKMRNATLAFAFLAIAMVALGCVGAAHFILVAVVAIVSLMAACFIAGMYVQAVVGK